MTQGRRCRVAVIGAGASGLTAIKALQEAGLTPIAFEGSSHLGGIWAAGADGAADTPSYHSLRANTSKQITAFSDFPFTPEVPDFPSRREIEQYLHAYARCFQLEQCIRFNVAVQAIQPSRDGTWRVQSSQGTEETFEAVLVCSGIFRRPIFPPIADLHTCTGTVLHSLNYHASDPFAGQHVVVVGLGSSAVDIAVDLAGTAAGVTVSTRQGAWLAPRLVRGVPLDHRNSRLATALPAAVQSSRRRRLLNREYRRHGIDSLHGLWRSSNVPFHPRVARSVTTDRLLPLLQSHMIEAKPAIRGIERNEIVFADQTRMRADAVICATGYDAEFSFLAPNVVPWHTKEAGLYRLVFPPAAPGLSFIGVCRAHGPILPIVEMQARWVAQVIAGRAHLPSPGAMLAEIERRTERQRRRNDAIIRVPLIQYLDEVATEIGVKPDLYRYRRLFPALLTGPPVAAQYRLQGPNAWPSASDVIRSAYRHGPSAPPDA